MPKVEYREISFYSSYVNNSSMNAQFYFHRYIWELLESKGLTNYSEMKLKGHVLLYKYAIEYIYEEFISMLNPNDQGCDYFDVVGYSNFKCICPANQNPIEIYVSGLKKGVSDMIKNMLTPTIPIFVGTAEMRNNTKRDILTDIETGREVMTEREYENITNIIFKNLVLLYKDTIYSVLNQSAYTIFCALRLTLNRSEDFFDLKEVYIDEYGRQQLAYKIYTYQIYKSKVQSTESQENKSRMVELYINSIPR